MYDAVVYLLNVLSFCTQARGMVTRLPILLWCYWLTRTLYTVFKIYETFCFTRYYSSSRIILYRTIWTILFYPLYNHVYIKKMKVKKKMLHVNDLNDFWNFQNICWRYVSRVDTGSWQEGVYQVTTYQMFKFRGMNCTDNLYRMGNVCIPREYMVNLNNLYRMGVPISSVNVYTSSAGYN